MSRSSQPQTWGGPAPPRTPNLAPMGDLEKAINGEEEREYLAIDYLEDLNEELPNDLGDSLTYKRKFPFGKYFERELTDCQDFIVENLFREKRFRRKLPLFSS